MLESNNLNETIDFYTHTLGFVCDSYDEKWGWSHLSHEGVSLMFSRPNEHRNIPKPVMSGSLYFYVSVSDVNSYWQTLKDRCHISYPIENFEYGMREFGIYDNNGYLLQFGQRVKEIL